jgi:acetyl-CoA C-acetyltransferase
MQDQFALTSQQRASKAIEDGVFKDQILPIEIKTRKGIDIFQIDEHLKPNTTMESLSGLRTAFKKDGVVTAGNASGINDGASALILANEEKAKKGKPLARIVSYGFGGVDPDEMGMGPVPATKMALNKAGLDVSDLDLIESNEAFAAQACAVNKQLGLDPEKVNVNGGAIALGHPVGATGAIIMTKLIYELRQRKGKYGLATMCIGGGQGIAVIIEAL